MLDRRDDATHVDREHAVPVLEIDRAGFRPGRHDPCIRDDDVEAYIAANDIIVNPLRDRGYPSIGCRPCTSPADPGADARRRLRSESDPEPEFIIALMKLAGELSAAGHHATLLVHPAAVVAPETTLGEGSIVLGGAYVSSSRVRKLIEAGQVEEAAHLLTRPYRLRGMVTHGSSRGHRIGFPTANVDAIDTLLPAAGVYAGRALLTDQPPGLQRHLHGQPLERPEPPPELPIRTAQRRR